MLEQRNEFINEMNNKISSHKKKFHSMLQKLGWTPQSVAGLSKEEHGEDLDDLNPKAMDNSDKMLCDKKEIEEKESYEKIILKQLEGTSAGDSEKRYNELLASLTFQPKLKKEKLSDTQLLASLLESERNAKRRRISYRNKVHTKNKSQIEVLREVIHEQMELLKDNEEGNDEMKFSSGNGKKEERDEMVEVRVSEGNPHLAWQNVSLDTEESQGERRKHHDKYALERIGSDSRCSGPDQRKNHHRNRHNTKHRRRSSSPYRSDSNHRSSRHSHSDKSSSRKKGHKYSPKHNSKKKNRDH